MAIDFKMKATIPEWEPLFEQGRTSVVERFSVLKDVTSTEVQTMTDVLDEMDNQGGHPCRDSWEEQSGSSNAELLDFLSSNEGERFFGFIGIDDMTVEAV